MYRYVWIIAAAFLTGVPLPARAQQRYEQQSPAPQQQRLSFRERFGAANTTNDGCLTLQQAQRGLPGVAKQFTQIDAEGHGCITLPEIRAFRLNQLQLAFPGRFAAANTSNDGCLTLQQAQQGLPGIAKVFQQIDVERRGCVTLAEITAFQRGQNPQPQPQAEPQPQPKPHSLNFSDRFAAANTTNDGCLTLQQAQQALPNVAKDFARMDAEGHGCVTEAEIRGFWHSHSAKTQEQPAPLPKDTPPPPAGY